MPGLFDLPVELRLEIFKYALTASRPIIWNPVLEPEADRIHDEQLFGTVPLFAAASLKLDTLDRDTESVEISQPWQLPTVNRQIHKEVHCLIHACNTILFKSAKDFSLYLHQQPEPHITAVKSAICFFERRDNGDTERRWSRLLPSLTSLEHLEIRSYPGVVPDFRLTFALNMTVQLPMLRRMDLTFGNAHVKLGTFRTPANFFDTIRPTASDLGMLSRGTIPECLLGVFNDRVARALQARANCKTRRPYSVMICTGRRDECCCLQCILNALYQ